MATIVLADDDPDLRGVYATYLRAVGHEVWEANDGLEAMNLVRAHRPVLLLLDLWMPSLNGFEVIDALRHDPTGLKLKIVVISNMADADARLAAFAGGAAEYLVKGLSLHDLRERVARFVAEAEAEAIAPIEP